MTSWLNHVRLLYNLGLSFILAYGKFCDYRRHSSVKNYEKIDRAVRVGKTAR